MVNLAVVSTIPLQVCTCHLSMVLRCKSYKFIIILPSYMPAIITETVQIHTYTIKLYFACVF